MLPALRRVGVIPNAADPFSRFVVEQTQLAGKTANIEIAPIIMARGPQEIEAAFANLKRENAGAVVVQAKSSVKDRRGSGSKARTAGGYSSSILCRSRRLVVLWGR
jgi:hypothetical protein